MNEDKITPKPIVNVKISPSCHCDCHWIETCAKFIMGLRQMYSRLSLFLHEEESVVLKQIWCHKIAKNIISAESLRITFSAVRTHRFA